jgi:hypothetical protein
VTLVNWHDKDQKESGWYGYRVGDASCTCYDRDHDRPYREFPDFY